MTLAILALGFVAVWLSSATGQEMRTWSDKSGKFKIKAKFVELSGKKVVLEKEDGSQVTVPLDRLSEADQKAAAEMGSAEENPFQAVKPAKKAAKKPRVVDEEEEEPAAKKPAKKKTTVVDEDEEEPVKKPAKKKRKAAVDEEEGEDEKGEARGAKMVKPRWTDVKEVLPPAPGGKWSLSIEVPEQPAKNGRPIAIPSKTDFFERMRALVISPVCRRAAIGYTSDRAALRTPSGRSAGGGLPDREGQTRIVLCDLESGQVLSTGTASGKSVPLALSDSGEQLLMRREDTGFGRSEVLETWRVTNSGITKELQFSPHDDTKGGADKIQWARYVDKERFVTAGTAGFLVVWNAAAKPLYWLKIDAQGRPALSPDRKYVVFATGKQIGVLDVTSGTVVAMQEFQQHLGAPVFAFTPGGTRLVCGTHDRVLVWDVATGALYREIPLAGARVQVGENLLCPSEDHLLAGNSVLVDIDSQAKLWTYRGPEAGAMLGGVCWFLVSPHDAAGALVPTVLPHPAAQEQIQKAMQSADFFVVKPGSSVKVNVSALADPAERERAGAALTKKLEANGCQVGPNGSIELVASVETGQRRQLSYGSHGPFFRGGSVSYSFQEYASRLKFVSQGQTLWEIAGTNNPGFMIHLKQGETIEQYLKAREHPNYDFFSSVEIPKMVQKSSQGGNTIGTSQVTVAGIQ